MHFFRQDVNYHYFWKQTATVLFLLFCEGFSDSSKCELSRAGSPIYIWKITCYIARNGKWETQSEPQVALGK